MANPVIMISTTPLNSLKQAQVVALNEHVEEDVTLLIDGSIINCFISYCPYEIEIGKPTLTATTTL